MRLERTDPTDRDERVYTLTISGLDFVRMGRLSRFDQMLLDDCNGPDATISDQLLALELIARRIEEGHNKGLTNQGLTETPA